MTPAPRKIALHHRMPAKLEDRPAAILASALCLFDLARERQPEREAELAARAVRFERLCEQLEERARS